MGNYAPTTSNIGQVAESKDAAKAERIRKLRESKPVEITGEEYKGKYELNRDSAQKYVLDTLRGEYTIKDTGEKVNLSKVGAKKDRCRATSVRGWNRRVPPLSSGCPTTPRWRRREEAMASLAAKTAARMAPSVDF